MAGLPFDLKDEKQAKQYLDTVSVEYRFQCFHEKKPDGCHRLADFLETIEKKLDKARKVFKENCENYQFGQSCFKYGNYNYMGKGGEKNVEEAYKYYEKGCSYGYAPACVNAGLMTLSPNHSDKPDYEKGMKLLEKACEIGDSKGCLHLTGLYISGRAGERNMQKAFQYAQKGCELEDRYSCANVSRMYDKGEGVEQDKTQAQKYKDIAYKIQDRDVRVERNVTGGEQ